MEGHFAFTQHTCIYTHLDHTRTTSEVTGVYIHIEVDTIITMFQVMPELINAAHVNLNLLSVMEITLTHIYIYTQTHTPTTPARCGEGYLYLLIRYTSGSFL